MRVNRPRRAWPAALLGLLAALGLTVPAAGSGGTAGSNPLAPPETSSPRATVQSLQRRVEELYRLARELPPGPERRERMAPRIRQLLTCFDQRELAPSTAEERAFEAAVLLKEIFDRVELADPSTYPDAVAARQADLERFTIPETEIRLVRVDSGPQQGEYLFSTETIERAPEFFEQVRQLPYHARATTPGAYDYYTSLQGTLVPLNWIEALPAWAKRRVADHALWQWLSLAASLALGVALVVASFLVGRRGPLASRPLGIWLRWLFPLCWMAVALGLNWIFSEQIRLTGSPLFVLKVGLRLQLFAGALVVALMLVNRLADLIIRIQRLRPEAVDSQLIRLGCRLLTILVVATVVVLAADYLGFAVTPLLAGLGVSGLAVALAAQHTIENLIGGLVLFADKPLRVGDLCRFSGTEGTIERIGLRSTRVRGSDRALITIPNSEFAKLQVVNLSRRDRMVLTTVLPLRAETSADQLRYLLVRLRELLGAHPALSPDPQRVRLIGCSAQALEVEVFAHVLTRQRAEFLAIQEDLLLQIMDLVRDAGTGFAIPISTQYEASDPGLDPERRRQAELQVQAWRDQGRLADAGFAATPSPEPLSTPALAPVPLSASRDRPAR